MRLKSHLKTQKPASVMVWAAVSPCGLKSPLVFIPKGVKVNTAVYLDMIKKKVLPWLNNTHWDHGWIFQQDGAPSHTSNKTQMWCNENLEGFWPKNMWPPSSPDLILWTSVSDPFWRVRLGSKNTKLFKL